MGKCSANCGIFFRSDACGYPDSRLFKNGANTELPGLSQPQRNLQNPIQWFLLAYDNYVHPSNSNFIHNSVKLTYWKKNNFLPSSYLDASPPAMPVRPVCGKLAPSFIGILKWPQEWKTGRWFILCHFSSLNWENQPLLEKVILWFIDSFFVTIGENPNDRPSLSFFVLFSNSHWDFPRWSIQAILMAIFMANLSKHRRL